VAELLEQHAAETGQRFEPEAVRRIWELAQGHPWLTSALAAQIVGRDVTDRSIPITTLHVESAKETIILERRSHIDSLVARLREPRVRRIVEPMLTGTSLPADLLDDDLSYVLGLGLVRVERGELQIANPIYREVIPRALTWPQQISIHQPTEWYVRSDGALDVPKLMAAWQTFWCKDGHLAAEGFGYREAGPHLMLMAFLQRIVNGGGRVEREYGLGRGALDLMIFWQGERHAIEVMPMAHRIVALNIGADGRAWAALLGTAEATDVADLGDLGHARRPRWPRPWLTRPPAADRDQAVQPVPPIFQPEIIADALYEVSMRSLGWPRCSVARAFRR
jgi:hypothetical protein